MLHQVGDLFELNVNLRCQMVNSFTVPLRPIVKSSGLNSVGAGALSAGDACKEDLQIVSKNKSPSVSTGCHLLDVLYEAKRQICGQLSPDITQWKVMFCVIKLTRLHKTRLRLNLMYLGYLY